MVVGAVDEFPVRENRGVALFFYLAYAAVIFAAFAVVGAVPGGILGLVAPAEDRRLALPAVAFATALWIWLGWLGPTYGISRLGLVLFAGIGAAGLVYGWHKALQTVQRVRTRQPRATGSHGSRTSGPPPRPS